MIEQVMMECFMCIYDEYFLNNNNNIKPILIKI